ncbi:hypothetical protein GW17_00019755 [Ensete ventricosum]|nr:hypothetical protein GW17_00019755 [Ensete ventricosum]
MSIRRPHDPSPAAPAAPALFVAHERFLLPARGEETSPRVGRKNEATRGRSILAVGSRLREKEEEGETCFVVRCSSPIPPRGPSLMGDSLTVGEGTRRCCGNYLVPCSRAATWRKALYKRCWYPGISYDVGLNCENHGLHSFVSVPQKSPAFDLLSRMLEYIAWKDLLHIGIIDSCETYFSVRYDPRKRITAAQALEHE